ncbi:hypothetical protein [Chloroflexus aggregans]|uniref:hypothetical protein n=1 Tax=Chloroflexus aggregans TaxID=152260 RepID=UPI0012EE92FD|nr:hypothetical protein [Chloroflexus aggregans]
MAGGGAARRGDPSGRPYTMGNPTRWGRTQWAMYRNGQRTAMGNAPRRPDANRRAVVMVGVWPVGVRHVGATRRVALTRWATHRVAPTRWATRPDGQRTTSPRREPACRGDGCGTVCGGAACRGDPVGRPNPMGNAPRRPNPMGNPTRWATHHVAPTQTGVPW